MSQPKTSDLLQVVDHFLARCHNGPSQSTLDAAQALTAWREIAGRLPARELRIDELEMLLAINDDEPDSVRG